MPEPLKKVASVPHHDLFIAEADDILIIIPETGFKDNAAASQVTVAALREYASNLGKRCGLVIMVNNILAQEPESRRVYAEGVLPELFFGIAMVVSNPLARIIGNLGLHLGTLKVPITLVETVEAGISWMENNRERSSKPAAG